MNLPNKLTLLRILLVPIFLLFITVKQIPYGTFIATFVFVIAAITDQLDGHIARSRNQITTFGKFMDPLADKLLVTSALIALVDLKIIAAWAAVIIIAREFAVSGLRTIAAAEGKIIAASMWGKVKTVTQIIAIITSLLRVNIESSETLLAYFSANSFMINIIKFSPKITMLLAIIITIISGVDYFAKNKKIIDTNK
ncbi:CDP-diacylglycerol--glycerol-3-phosphate 3-phosphatidyltransferase [Clostridium sp.]|uniref:CDP-diacylglycerol--glycerol-3-phosphate 3-phosphatidyltransferase n=1 Tax=Clostridium sp. TaxID=1506 RepID=UPI002633ADCC|nr:CDP-diacylglycerol--glycerol-3-phosphate 3-phosphatidyltransferase [Clostridium sp.]